MVLWILTGKGLPLLSETAMCCPQSFAGSFLLRPGAAVPHQEEPLLSRQKVRGSEVSRTLVTFQCVTLYRALEGRGGAQEMLMAGGPFAGRKRSAYR